MRQVEHSFADPVWAARSRGCRGLVSTQKSLVTKCQEVQSYDVESTLVTPADSVYTALCSAAVMAFTYVISEAAHSSTYMTRSSEEVMQPSGWALFSTTYLGVHY